MEKEEALLIKRFKELDNRSYNRGVYEYSDFLNMYEQDLLFKNINTSFSLFGGYENAERQIAVFGNEERILLCARYDNLGKGASGAAVQCMNISMGVDLSTGLNI